MDNLKVSKCPLHWNDYVDKGGNVVDHGDRPYRDDGISLDTIVGRIKKKYNWPEAQMGPNVKVVIALGRLVDAKQDPSLLEEPEFEFLTRYRARGMPIVVPNPQDRDRVREYD